jgi:hypothetical protein
VTGVFFLRRVDMFFIGLLYKDRSPAFFAGIEEDDTHLSPISPYFASEEEARTWAKDNEEELDRYSDILCLCKGENIIETL